jgi:type IV secretion system protein VirD4
MIGSLILALVSVWWLDVAAVAALASAVLFYRCVLGRRAQVRNRLRAQRWRIKCRLRAGPGFASLPELVCRWSRLAAVSHGRRARPDLTLRERLRGPVTGYAVRFGRGQYFRRVFGRMEDQVLILAPPRVGKSGLIADRILDHPGPVLATTTRADLHALTAPARAALGPVHVFNPEDVGDLPSTFGWDLISPCRDLTVAYRMAGWLAGGRHEKGDLEWFAQKADIGLQGLLHAAALSGRRIPDVYQWSQQHGYQDALRILAARPGGNPLLVAAVSRVMEDNRTAASIRATMDHVLRFAILPQLAVAVDPLPGEEFDVDDFLTGNGTLYMIASGDEDSPISQMFRAMASYIHYRAGLVGTRALRGRLDPPLLMALDEVTQICPVDLPSMLADSAGKGVLITAVCHSVSQLEDRWGQHGASTIRATCGAKMLLPGIADDKTLEQVSGLCGTVTIGAGEDKATVPAVPPELIRGLPDWRALIIRTNLSPAVVKIRPVWKRPENRWPTRLLYRRRVPVPLSVPALEVPVEEPGPAVLQMKDLDLSAGPEMPAEIPTANGHSQPEQVRQS